MSLGNLLYAAENSERTRQELAAVSNAIGEIQTWLIEAQATQSQEAANLALAEQKISSISNSVEANRRELSETESEMNALSNQLSRLEAEKKALNNLLAQAIRTAYMTGNQSALKLLLNQEDFSQSARLLHYHRVFTESQLANIASFEKTLDELAVVNEKLESVALQLGNQRIELNEELSTLNDSKEQRELALTELNASISSRSSKLEQLKIDQAELQQLIEQINRAIADIPASLQDSPFIEQQGKLRMPVNGVIGNRFGSRYGDGDLRHQGITIGVSEGTPVQAIHPGRVVFSDWLRGTGLLVIVDHGEGYMSLYGSNQALSKQAGDWVDAGDILATSGTASDMITSQDSNLLNTGIYFEIRHHGEAQNPSDWIEK